MISLLDRLPTTERRWDALEEDRTVKESLGMV